ncbi:ArsC/Spx/MgsR family protein [Pseudooceanicola spongiae]|jgi:arsenate reductase (glutaredoxin)|uniref:Arsenate reductase n=1 Tax=Pseudooceanicola spongiae TaxID=2613965 RepID=A0A7L9WMQ3_9RHOB|nr:ArsC/Spx/MgsR family protein [Pseudooceanicola spongiae]QOL81202.1 arsenate reductase [Pseudooceanicola spongiae]|tara:strand:- start:1147 stop:1461 length:315 start_codon:yes stop_codon:yes gene_type:complete
MNVYGIKACDTCRKALKELGNPELTDIRTDGLPEELLQRAAETFGDDLLNRRSTTWRALDEATRARPMRELLREHPLLMKRPLIEQGETLYLGWTPEVRAALLG